MGLTRIRADQISDIDYKQAVRVITLSNITLSGGAPSTVDGVNLAAFDRILVAGQSTGSQNGLYYVQTLGTGNNGTWTRTIDGNETGEIEAGMVVMVTEGTTYADSQWKLVTNNPITIGSTALTFEQSSAYAFGIISANGTTISADSVGDTLTITPGTGIRVIGNATNDSIALSANLTELIGGSNYQIQYNNNGVFGGAPKFIYDNSTGRVIANAEIASTSTSTGTFIVQGGAAVTGNLHAGNITGSNITTEGIVSATGNINTSGAININGTNGMYNVLNITGTALGPYGGSQTWKFFTQNAVPGGPGSWILFPDSSTQTTAYPGTSSALSLSGNITGDNLISNSAVVAAGNITGGNLITTGKISATGTITTDAGTNGTGFAVGNGAVSNVGLGFFPTAGTRGDYAIRDYSSVFSTIYLDVGMGGSAGGEFQFRTSNAYNLIMRANTAGVYSSGIISGTELTSTQSSANEGGQINLALPSSGSTLTDGIILDIYQNKLRFFERGGTNRGAFIDITQAGAGVSTNLLASGGGGTPGGSDTYVQFNDSGIFGGDAQFTFNKTTGYLKAPIIESTNNGNGTNFKIGDDAWIGDINTADTIRIAGQQNAANAYIVFGNAIGGTLGRAGSGPLTYGGDFSVAGNITARGRNVPTYFTGNTAPTSPVVGDEWYYLATDTLYKYIDDGTSNLWININSSLYNANTAAIANTLALRDSGGNLTATNFFGVASSAKYADLAENYVADAIYTAGTVVIFGGEQEITVSNVTHDTRIAGVISTAPAYLMNSEAAGLPVAFTGRVPCWVQGPVNKGDLLVNSKISGVAVRLDKSLYSPGCVIGKALEHLDNETKLIEIVVGRF